MKRIEKGETQRERQKKEKKKKKRRKKRRRQLCWREQKV